MFSKLLKAIGRWIRGESDALAESIGDPVRDAGLHIEDSKRAVDAFTRKIAAYMAQQKLVNKSIKTTKEEVSKWEDLAIEAGQMGKLEAVREAVSKKKSAEDRLSTFQAEFAKNEENLTVLRKQLKDAKEQIRLAESELASLAARNEGNKIRKELAEAQNEFSESDSPLAALGNLRKIVDREEEEANALEELNKDYSSKSEDFVEKYGLHDPAVEEEVAKYMVKPVKSKSQQKREAVQKSAQKTSKK